MAKSAAGQNEA